MTQKGQITRHEWGKIGTKKVAGTTYTYSECIHCGLGKKKSSAAGNFTSYSEFPIPKCITRKKPEDESIDNK